MRVIAVIVFLIGFGLAEQARADMSPPTCEQMKAAYEAITSAPVSAGDDSLSRVAAALAENKIFAKDASLTDYATRDDLIAHVSKFSAMDQVLWVFRQYNDLEAALTQHGCAFEKREIMLRAPAPVPLKCVPTGPPPNKLPE